MILNAFDSFFVELDGWSLADELPPRDPNDEDDEDEEEEEDKQPPVVREPGER
jgi:hypothetical protein